MIPTSVSNAGVARWWHGVTFVVVAASLVLQLTSLVVTVVSWRWRPGAGLCPTTVPGAASVVSTSVVAGRR